MALPSMLSLLGVLRLVSDGKCHDKRNSKITLLYPKSHKYPVQTFVFFKNIPYFTLPF